MLLESYFRENYCDVCKTQNSFDHDKKLVKSMLNGNVKHRDLKEWMRVYGLFQGIKSEDRDTIVNNVIDYNNNHIRILDVDRHTYFEVFGDIFDILYNAKKRMWISASTKLMWLMYPDETIIYDSFVFRSVVIIQSLDSELSKLPKIGNRPTINSIKNLHIIIEHYMKYYDIINQIHKMYKPLFEELRKKHNETYKYDIRILDKLLWMIGNPK